MKSFWDQSVSRGNCICFYLSMDTCPCFYLLQSSNSRCPLFWR